MEKKYRIIGVIAIVVATITALTGSALADEPDDGTGSYGSFAPYPAGETTKTVADIGLDYAIYSALQRAGCRYTTEADNPHRSSGDASAHGWWLKDPNSSCPRYADVSVKLEAYFCAEGYGCWWVTKSYNEERIRAGGGRGRRTTARYPCVSSNRVGWKSTVDVDLVGHIDPWNKVSKTANLDCSPTR